MKLIDADKLKEILNRFYTCQDVLYKDSAMALIDSLPPASVPSENEIKSFIESLGWKHDGTAEVNDMLKVANFVINYIKSAPTI